MFRRTLGAVVLMALPLAAGCGAGKDNTPIRATPYVANADAGDMAVRGIRIIPTTSGDNTGYLLATVVNRGQDADTLTNATVAGGAVTPSGVTGFSVDPSHTLQFSTPDIGGSDAATLKITASPTPLTIGTTVPVTFTFQNAGSVEVDVPVKSAEQVGATATSAPVATTGSYPSPTESPSPESTEPATSATP